MVVTVRTIFVAKQKQEFSKLGRLESAPTNLSSNSWASFRKHFLHFLQANVCCMSVRQARSVQQGRRANHVEFLQQRMVFRLTVALRAVEPLPTWRESVEWVRQCTSGARGSLTARGSNGDLRVQNVLAGWHISSLVAMVGGITDHMLCA